MAKQTMFEGQHDDETVLEVYRHHPVVLRKGLYAVLILVVLGMVPISIWPEELIYLWAVPGGLLLGLVIFFYYWIGWYFSIFIITDQRFIRITQKGLFNRTVIDLGLDKIQNINYQIGGFQQTVLKFGTIVIQTFVGDMTLDKMPHPAEIQEAIIRTMKEHGIQADTGQEETDQA